jgi:hypothetical protein
MKSLHRTDVALALADLGALGILASMPSFRLFVSTSSLLAPDIVFKSASLDGYVLLFGSVVGESERHVARGSLVQAGRIVPFGRVCECTVAPTIPEVVARRSASPEEYHDAARRI